MTDTTEQRSGLLTAEEIAAHFRVKPETVRGWARQGIVPSIKLSHKMVRYRLDDVIEALQRRGGLSEGA